MDLTDTQQMDVEKRRAVLKALDKLQREFDQTLLSLIDEKLPSTEVPPIQLELQLDFSQCITPARLLKVSEPCTKVTQSPS